MDVRLRLHDVSRTSWKVLKKFALFFVLLFFLSTSAGWTRIASLPDWRSQTFCTCISPGTPLNATWLAQGFCQSLIIKRERRRRRRRRRRGRRRLREMQGFILFLFRLCVVFLARIYWRRLFLSTECLSQPHATLRTAQLMPYNYAQTMLSDQTNSCSHQVHGVLVFECTVQSLGLLLWGTTPAVLYFLLLLLLLLLLFCTETKWSSDFEHSISLCLVCLLRFCIVAQIVFVVWTFLKDNRCFSYFSWFVFCCKCCKTVDKTVYNLLRQPFLGRLRCRARFCKSFGVLTFLIHACCSYNLNNKTCCWQMFDFHTVGAHVNNHLVMSFFQLV